LLLAVVLLGCPPAKPAAPPKPVEPRYSIHLTDVGPNRAEVVDAVVTVRGCTKQLADGLIKRKGARSLLIKADVSEAEGKRGVAALEKTGAKARLVKLELD
jgi:hypothetical protein